jgi:hypothetical protein
MVAVAAVGGSGMVYHGRDGTTAGRETALAPPCGVRTCLALVGYNLPLHVKKGDWISGIVVSIQDYLATVVHGKSTQDDGIFRGAMASCHDIGLRGVDPERINSLQRRKGI